jgi:hypothetical protein
VRLAGTSNEAVVQSFLDTNTRIGVILADCEYAQYLLADMQRDFDLSGYAFILITKSSHCFTQANGDSSVLAALNASMYSLILESDPITNTTASALFTAKLGVCLELIHRCGNNYM